MIMRKITDSDLEKIIGTSICGYHIENARIKNGEYCDSDNYGILLGKNDRGVYVTWQFHFNGDDISVYWGHYTEKRELALQDFYNRDAEHEARYIQGHNYRDFQNERIC